MHLTSMARLATSSTLALVGNQEGRCRVMTPRATLIWRAEHLSAILSTQWPPRLRRLAWLSWL